MGNLFRKAASILLALTFVVGSAATLSGISIVSSATSSTELVDGETIEYGLYPQSRVTDEALISELNALEQKWTYYEYYAGSNKELADLIVIGSAARLDFMKYCDVEYNGERYRGVYYEKFRPDNASLYPSDSNSGLKLAFALNTVYWYKYEPISWKVIDAESGTLLAIKALDAQPFNNFHCLMSAYKYYVTKDKYPANDYAHSSLRTWLNNDFYNTAFNENEKSGIKTSVINVNESTVSDKVYLLSDEDVVNTEYGFSADKNETDIARRFVGSEYAQSQGLRCYFTISNGRVNSLNAISSYTRSAGDKDNTIVSCDNNGKVTQIATIDGCNAVVPAIKINTGKYTLTLDANSGKFDNGNSLIERTYKAGEAVGDIEVPHKDGCTFIGWDITIPAAMPEKDLIATAVWKGEEHKAVFNPNGGKFNDGTTVSKTVITECGKKIEAPTVTKKGYIFKGWSPAVPAFAPAADLEFSALWEAATDTLYCMEYYYMDINGEYGSPTYKFASGTTGATVSEKPKTEKGYHIDTDKSILSGIIASDGSLVLKVYYARNKYTITFNGNGGTVNGKSSVSESYYHGAAVASPTDLQKNGYTFSGWDTAVVSPAAADAVYNAQWKANSYKVTYIVDGNEIHADSFAYGEVTVPYDYVPQKTGCTFTGWVNDLPETMPANDIIRTASWSVNSYNAKFYIDIDAADYETVSVEYGSEIIPPTSPLKTGYVFAGWSLDGVNILDDLGVMDSVNGKSFYAVWLLATDIRYTVETYTMNTQGVYEVSSRSFSGMTGEKVTAEYTVSEGFALNKEKSILNGTIAADDSLVLKVYIDRNSYALTTIVDGKETTVNYLYGAIISKPEDPSKPGFKFIRWSGDIPDTMPANDINITAVFEQAYTCPDCGKEIVGEDAIAAHIKAESALKATVKIKNNPGDRIIKFGETLRLTAETSNLPDGVEIVWYVDGDEVARGETFEISFENGTKTVEVKLVDSQGNVLRGRDGTESTDYQTVTVKSNLWLRIIAFFKKLFGKRDIIVQSIMG